jgi:hypothetical protein
MSYDDTSREEKPYVPRMKAVVDKYQLGLKPHYRLHQVTLAGTPPYIPKFPQSSQPLAVAVLRLHGHFTT